MPRYQIYRGLKGHPVGEPGQAEFSAPRFACQRAVVSFDAQGNPQPATGDFVDRFDPIVKLYEVATILEKACRQGHLEKVGPVIVAKDWAEAHLKAAPFMPADAATPEPLAPAKAQTKVARAAGGE